MIEDPEVPFVDGMFHHREGLIRVLWSDLGHRRGGVGMEEGVMGGLVEGIMEVLVDGREAIVMIVGVQVGLDLGRLLGDADEASIPTAELRLVVNSNLIIKTRPR